MMAHTVDGKKKAELLGRLVATLASHAPDGAPEIVVQTAEHENSFDAARCLLDSCPRSEGSE
jgi:hypothetical protein